jgi:hypothetical protein
MSHLKKLSRELSTTATLLYKDVNEYLFNPKDRLQYSVRCLVGGGVGRAGVGGVAIASSSRGVDLKAASTVSTEVVHVGGVGPLGVDGGIVVESALKKKKFTSLSNIFTMSDLEHDDIMEYLQLRR